MPLGDPCGGNFIYIDEGLPKTMYAATVPVSNISNSLKFYETLLKFKIIDKTEKECLIEHDDCRLLLKESSSYGVDTGIYIGVDNPFDLHRRLIDEGVIFVRDPINSILGVYTSFYDFDKNIISAVDKLGKVRN